MVKGFSTEEKQRIRGALIEKGRELFGAYGLKKTSIADLTDDLGIAQGSFYLFFPSKEMLYFEVLEEEEKYIKEKVLTFLQEGDNAGQTEFAEVLFNSISLVEHYPIIYRLFTTDDYQLMLRKLPQEKLEEHALQDTFDFTPLLKMWAEEGKTKDWDPQLITGVIRSYMLLLIHKQEIGETVFEDVMRFHAEAIAAKVFEVD